MPASERSLIVRMRKALGRALPAPLRAPALWAHRTLRALATFARHPTWTRFALRWLLSLRSGRNALVDGTPWIPYRAAEWLESYLEPTINVFEWGSGGSTIFIARRAGRLVAVEHSPVWEARIAGMLRRRSITNCDLLFVGADAPGAGGEACHEARFDSLWVDGEKTSFERYVKTIDAYPDGHFDLVSVDGHARLACIARAVPKVRPEGTSCSITRRGTARRPRGCSKAGRPRSSRGRGLTTRTRGRTSSGAGPSVPERRLERLDHFQQLLAAFDVRLVLRVRVNALLEALAEG